MQKIEIQIPTEDYSIIEYSQNGVVGMATINQALRGFNHKSAFPWHLSLIIVCNELNQDKMPSKAENDTLRAFEESLGTALQANSNAIFLASITKNGYRELIWRVHSPYSANDYLLDLIEQENHPRPFDFTLDEDTKWHKTEWHFNMLDKKPDYAMPGEQQ